VGRFAEQHPPAAVQLDHQGACGYRGQEPRVGGAMTSSVTSPSQGSSRHNRRQIQQNSDDVNLQISYDVNSARNNKPMQEFILIIPVSCDLLFRYLPS
jgi:hypothetical protein